MGLTAGTIVPQSQFPKLSDLPVLANIVTYSPDPVSDTQYGTIIYANKPDTTPGDTGYQQRYYSMKARHLIYWKNTNPPVFTNGVQQTTGSCPVASGAPKPGALLKTLDEVSTGLGLAGLAVSTGVQIAAYVAGESTGALLASIAPIAALSGVIGIATLGLGLLLVPLEFIFAHHAKAVALEQGTLCELWQAINPLMDDIDLQFYTKQITHAQAKTAFQNLINGFIYQAQKAGIYKAENEAGIIEQELQDNWSLRDTILYPSMIYPSSTIANIINAPPTETITVTSGGVQQSQTIALPKGGTSVATPESTLPKATPANAPASAASSSLFSGSNTNTIIVTVIATVLGAILVREFVSK